MPITFDRLASRYDKSMEPLEKWFLRSLRKEAIASLPQAGRILELGAGTGLNFVFYSPALHGVATEPSTEMLRIAARKTKPDSLTLVQSYAEHLPFADDSFDGALTTLMMCSVQSPELVFGELRRVVRAGGRISMLEHVRPQGILGLVFDVLNVFTVFLINDHVNRRPSETAKRIGLEVTTVRKVGWGIFNLITCVV